MIKYYLSIFTGITLVCASLNMRAQTSSAAKQELVLEVSTITSKNYEEVKNALSGTTGIILQAFCEDFKCFLLTYNPSIIESTDNIEKIVQQLHPSYKTKIRTNVTSAELINNCKIIIPEASPAPEAD